MNNGIVNIDIWSGTKVDKNKVQIFILAILSGIYIAFGALASMIISNGTNIPGIAKLLSAIVF